MSWSHVCISSLPDYKSLEYLLWLKIIFCRIRGNIGNERHNLRFRIVDHGPAIIQLFPDSSYWELAKEVWEVEFPSIGMVFSASFMKTRLNIENYVSQLFLMPGSTCKIWPCLNSSLYPGAACHSHRTEQVEWAATKKQAGYTFADSGWLMWLWRPRRIQLLLSALLWRATPCCKLFTFPPSTLQRPSYIL